MKIVNNISYRLKEYTSTIIAFKPLAPFLERGIYTIRAKRVEKGIGLPFVLVLKSSGNANKDVKTITLYYGGWSDKIVAFVGDKVYSFYSQERQKEIEYIAKYYDEINYPKCKIHEIFPAKRYSITEKVNGTSYFDIRHIKILARDIISFNASETMHHSEEFPAHAEFNKFNIPFYLQHGDFTAKNAIWTSDSQYTLIDFDTIDFFPCFYDLLKLLMMEDFGAEGFKIYIDGEFDKDILDFIKRCNIIDNVQVFKDKCLAAFILFTYTFWDTAKAVRANLPETYNFTKEILDTKAL